MNYKNTFKNWPARARDPQDITWAASRRFSHAPKPPKTVQPKVRIPRARQFDGAESSTILNDWSRDGISCDADLFDAAQDLRARAKDLCQNNQYAKRFLRLLETNVVGPDGIRLQMAKKRNDGTPDKLVNDLIEAGWKDFLNRENFTVTGTVPGVAGQNLMIKGAARTGEILLRKVSSFRHNRHKFAIQFIDPERLDHYKNTTLSNGNIVRMGVEFDQWRRPVRYHFRENTRDWSLPHWEPVKNNSNEFSLPASEIIHAFVSDYEEQTRGYTWFHAAMKQLRHLGKYQEAAIVEARVGAAKMGFFKPERDANGEYVGDDELDDGTLVSEASAGSFEILPKGYSLETWNPGSPNREHSDFSKAMLKGISAGLCVCYPSLAADLEGVNYSSIRAGLIEDRDGYRMLQNFLIDSVMKDVFQSWLEVQLTHDAVLPNFLTQSRFQDVNKPKFEGRAWEWVDPQKDINAEILAIDNGIKSRQRVQRQMGIDPEDEAAEIAADSFVPKTAPPAAAPAAEADDDEEEFDKS
jgi:lambda family phage portal protein